MRKMHALLVEGTVIAVSQMWARTQCPEWACLDRGHREYIDWMGENLISRHKAAKVSRTKSQGLFKHAKGIFFF